MRIRMQSDEEADVRTDAGIKILAMFFVAIMVLAFTTNPIATGTKVGERAPTLEGKAYNGGGWTEFDMDSYFNSNWTKGDVNNGSWMLIDFMDTDCPFCVRSADDVATYSDYFMKIRKDGNGNPEWQGPTVTFVASATQLDIPGHESSRDEIIAFRDKSGTEECDGSSCATRPGAAHNFIYIDDLDQDNMKRWKVPGTPSYFLIQPDGIVAWSSAESNGETFYEAIGRLTLAEA
jgi:hypothetical protein